MKVDVDAVARFVSWRVASYRFFDFSFCLHQSPQKSGYINERTRLRVRQPDRFPKSSVDQVTRYGGGKRLVVITKNSSDELLSLVFVLCIARFAPTLVVFSSFQRPTKAKVIKSQINSSRGLRDSTWSGCLHFSWSVRREFEEFQLFAKGGK